MVIPRFDEVHEAPLTSDEEVLVRVDSLIGRANRRQIWLLFLDAQDRQLPLLMPCEVPTRPGRMTGAFPGFLRELVESVEADAIVSVLERRRGPELTEGDRIWLRLLRDAPAGIGVRQRGPILSSRAGVRWIAPEDLE